MKIFIKMSMLSAIVLLTSFVNTAFAGNTFENDRDICLLFTEEPILDLPQNLKDSIVKKEIGFVLMVKVLTDFQKITNVWVFPVLNLYNHLDANDSLWQKIQYYTLESAKKWKVRPDDIVEKDSVDKFIKDANYEDKYADMIINANCEELTFIGTRAFFATIVIGFIDPEDQDSDVGWARLFGPAGQRNCYLQYLVNEDEYEQEDEGK